MALSSCTERYGIAGAVYKPLPISEEPAGKQQPYPAQPNPTSLTLTLAVPTKHGVSQPGLVCSSN